MGPRSPTPWEALSENYDAIRDLIEKAIDGFDEFNARVRQPGGFLLKNSARERTWRTPAQKAVFTAVPLPHHDLAPEELLLMTIRSHDQFNTTVYERNDRYRDIEGERRVVFLNPLDLQARRLSPGAVVDVTSTYDGVVRVARSFRCVPYAIPQGCAAAYFPETNPVVPLHAHSKESGTPASKSIRVRLVPVAPSSEPRGDGNL